MSNNESGSAGATSVFAQRGFDIRFEWGPTGARAVRADVAVIVDVLSFSTSVTIAVGRGMTVFPYPWKDDRAADFAAAHDAVLAVGRLEATKSERPSAPSLSPAGLLAGEAVPRLVLPSPNGSTIAAVLGDTDSQVVIGCVRNAGAVSRWLADAIDQHHSVAVIAAGERWASDDSLRPASEDQLGAGAILAGLRDRGFGDRMSPESVAAATLFDAVQGDLSGVLHEVVSGRELVAKGFASDVAVAAERDVSSVVPILVDGAFGPCGLTVRRRFSRAR